VSDASILNTREDDDIMELEPSPKRREIEEGAHVNEEAMGIESELRSEYRYGLAYTSTTASYYKIHPIHIQNL